MLDFLRRLYDYDRWAISHSLSSLANSENRKAQAMLAHVLLAEQIWLTRLHGEDSSTIPTFEELSLAECAELSNELRQSYRNFLNSLTEEDLNAPITYRNTKGVEFQTPMKDVLTHVGLHGAYHRGQIALLVRENGGEAVNTDYITFTRL